VVVVWQETKTSQYGMTPEIFSALHGMQTWSSDENSVCQMHDLWQNKRMMCPDFCTIWKITA